MDKPTFRRWLLKSLDDLRHDDPDYAHFEDCAEIVSEAGEYAAALGLPEVYLTCRVGRLVGIGTARSILSSALAALPEKPEYLNAAAAAEYLGVPVKKLYTAVEHGRLTPLRGPKNSYRFTVEMLDCYLGA